MTAATGAVFERGLRQQYAYIRMNEPAALTMYLDYV